MSYYKVKSVKFDKEANKIFITAASSNVMPVSYFQSEYQASESFEEKTTRFWTSVMEGNMVFNKDNQWNTAVDNAYSIFNRISENITDFWRNDYDHKTLFYKELQEYVSKTYLVPIVTNVPSVPDDKYEAEFAAKCIEAWKNIDKERKDKNLISIRAAIRSSVFPECDVMLSADDEWTIVAKAMNYNNKGLLNDSDKSAVFIEGDQFSTIGYAKLDLLKNILSTYPDLLKFCMPEASYASEERCSMDGYELVYESDEKILYAKSDGHGYCSYAEITGWS